MGSTEYRSFVHCWVHQSCANAPWGGLGIGTPFQGGRVMQGRVTVSDYPQIIFIKTSPYFFFLRLLYTKYYHSMHLFISSIGNTLSAIPNEMSCCSRADDMIAQISHVNTHNAISALKVVEEWCRQGLGKGETAAHLGCAWLLRTLILHLGYKHIVCGYRNDEVNQ